MPPNRWTGPDRAHLSVEKAFGFLRPGDKLRLVQFLRRELAKRDARVRRIIKLEQSRLRDNPEAGYLLSDRQVYIFSALENVLAALSGRKGRRG